MRRVRAETLYIYEPVGIDLWEPNTRARPGQLVRVRNLTGCPPANTMGHCHIVEPSNGEIIGLVLVNSLQTVTNRRN
jgi:hypothetical protein